MRIAIFTNNYLPNPYGVSMSIESFRREFEKRGHAVYIFAPHVKNHIDENPNIFRYPSVDVNYKIHFPLPLPHSGKINKILKGLEVDVIHSQHPNLLGTAARKWAQKKNAPLIFTWHTLYDKYTNFVPIIPKKLAAWWAIRNAVRYANLCDQVVAPTKSVEKIIRTWGVTNENIVDIPSGVDEKEFAGADGRAVRQKYKIAENEVVAFMIGRITAEKNVQFLMQAMALALKKNNSLKFMISGEGYEIPAMQKIAAENGVAEKVIFSGLVPYAERKNYFAAADFFVYSSKSETQGMILTEAAYMNLPVVAVAASGSDDVVQNGRTGFLVAEKEKEFANKVTKLIKDASLCRKMGENAQKVARENFTATICAEKMLAVYEKAIKNKKI
jgi:1,2-diacylglycerol 3-alpha-glucosyltransferase